MTDEAARLRDAARTFSTWEGLNAQLDDFCMRSLDPHLRPGSVLELGSADGRMTALLVERFGDVSIVEGMPDYVDQVRARFPQVTSYASLFEDFEPPRRYDNVLAAHVLEHVQDPVAILRRIATWLAPEGRVHVVVPNALSLHRLVGVRLGLLGSPTELHADDRRIGHRRVYTPEALEADLSAAGLRALARGGIFLKPLSNAQIESQWSRALVEGYYEVGKQFPRHTAEIYVVCER
ncbi:MAG: class I SAM-dependent methyltransferase [Longimicrobiales bacterium]